MQARTWSATARADVESQVAQVERSRDGLHQVSYINITVAVTRLRTMPSCSRLLAGCRSVEQKMLMHHPEPYAGAEAPWVYCS